MNHTQFTPNPQQLQLPQQSNMQNFKEWYYSQPLFTRIYLTICSTFSVLISLNLISTYHIFYTFESAFLKLHVWRPLTAFLFIEKLDITFIISLYVLYFSLKRLESLIKSGEKYAEFLWMIFLLLTCCVAVGSFINLYFFTDTFIVSIAFISTRKEKSQKIPLFSKITIDTKILPYIYLVLIFFMRFQLSQVRVSQIPELLTQNLSLLQASSALVQITGFLFGLILGKIYMLLFTYQSRYLKTPSFLSNLCQNMGKNLEKFPPPPAE